MSWRGAGFYYSRYPAPEKGKELTTKNENHRVYYHTIGTPQAEDVLAYEDTANPQRFHVLQVTEDERYGILTISDRGKGKKSNALFYRDFSRADTTFTPIVAEIGDDTFGFVDNVGDKLLLYTDKNAPNARVVLWDPKDTGTLKDVIPEKPEPLRG